MALIDMARKLIGVPNPEELTACVVCSAGCRTGVDLGCGSHSPLSLLRPQLTTTGLDAFPTAIELARARNLHDKYIVVDILKTDPAEILAHNDGKLFDVVAMYDVIEHFPKRLGYEILERCEKLTSRLVIVQTPNGFQEQGPEFGNEFQRHLSGWFIHDFEGLGYRVHGTAGMKWFHGYAGQPKYTFPGWYAVDAACAWLWDIHKHPRHAFTLFAVKDVRGVPARLPQSVT